MLIKQQLIKKKMCKPSGQICDTFFMPEYLRTISVKAIYIKKNPDAAILITLSYIENAHFFIIGINP